MLPLDLILLVCDYIPRYVMIDWVEKLIPRFENDVANALSENISALDYYVEKYPSRLRYMYWHPGIAPYIIIDTKINPPFINVFEMEEINNKLDMNEEFDTSNRLFDDWYALCKNGGMIELLEKCMDKVDWEGFYRNPENWELIQKYPHQIDWKHLSVFPEAIDILEKNPHCIHWKNLVSNNKSAPLWRAHPEKLAEVDWYSFTEEGPMEIIMENQDKIHWNALLPRSDAIKLVMANLDKINWNGVALYYKEYIPVIQNMINDLIAKNDDYSYEKNMLNMLLCAHSTNVDEILEILNYAQSIDEDSDLYNLHDYCEEILGNNDRIIEFARDSRFMDFILKLDNSDLCEIYHNSNIFKETVNKDIVNLLIKLL